MTVIELKEQLSYLRAKWVDIKGKEIPEKFQDILNMVTTSFKHDLSLGHWEINTPYVSIPLRLIIVAAGTPAFAESTLS